MASSRASSSLSEFQPDLHRHSSFSSTEHDVRHTLTHSLEHSPLESPNGSIITLTQSNNEFTTKPLTSSNSMEFHYHDEEESDGNVSGEPPPDQKLTKRDIHSLNEQRRRDQIKQGYGRLLELVPTCRPSSAGSKPSRAVILQRTIDYILYLHNQSLKEQEQVEELEKEVKALKIMKENYEQISKAHLASTSSSSQQIPDHVKFLVFQGLSDQLFQSFNCNTSVTSFDTLSSCIINWLEEYCKPETLKDIIVSNLRLDNVKLTDIPSLPTAAANVTTTKYYQRTS